MKEKCSQRLMCATETVNSWQNTRKLVLFECLTTPHSNHLSGTSSGKKNPQFLEMFVLKMQINIFLFISSHIDGSISYTMSAERYGAYLTTSEKGYEGSGSPSKVSLKTLFSFAKEGVVWLRTHGVRLAKCLQFASSSVADAEKASFALASPAHVLQPPLQVLCWCCWQCSLHKY